MGIVFSDPWRFVLRTRFSQSCSVRRGQTHALSILQRERDSSQAVREIDCRDISKASCFDSKTKALGSQLGTLREIVNKAKENGVNDVERIDRAEVQILEPHVRCFGACLSPSTGIVDSHQLMHALQADAEAAGATFAFGSKVIRGDVSEPIKTLQIEDQEGSVSTISAQNIVNAAGLHAWKVAASLQGYKEKYLPKGYYAKGHYFYLKGRAPFTRLIYPIPEPGGLGIHLTIDLQGKAKFGPDVEWIERIDFTIDPSRVNTFYDAIRCYYPDLAENSLMPDYVGIRPKNSGPGEPAADFIIQTHQSHIILGLIHLFGIESPGLTAALAIGDYVAETLDG